MLNGRGRQNEYWELDKKLSFVAFRTGTRAYGYFDSFLLVYGYYERQ